MKNKLWYLAQKMSSHEIVEDSNDDHWELPFETVMKRNTRLLSENLQL